MAELNMRGSRIKIEIDPGLNVNMPCPDFRCTCPEGTFHLIIPEFGEEGESYPGDIEPGYYNRDALSALLYRIRFKPDAVQFVAEMLEETMGAMTAGRILDAPSSEITHQGATCSHKTSESAS